MNIKTIHKSISDSLKSKFNIPCYSRDTTETNQKPCFVVELDLSGLSQDNKRLDDYSLTIEITYITTKRDDIAFYNILEQVKEMFKHRIKVNVGTAEAPVYRYLQVTSFIPSYAGENEEQLVFDIDTRFKDINTLAEPTELMSELILNEEII